MLFKLDFHVKNDLIYNGDCVGWRIVFNGRFYDVALDDVELMIEDFGVTVYTIQKSRKPIELIEKGSLLVPSDNSNEEEMNYNKFVNWIGLERLGKTDTDLKRLYNKYNKEIFNNELPTDVCVYWSNQMTAGAGVCKFQWSSESSRYEDFSIGMSVPYHNKYPEDVADTLVHEMIHMKYPDETHGRGFKSEMGRINSEFGMNITIYSKGRATEKKYNYVYACRECGQEYKRVRRHKNDYRTSRCGVCRGRIYLKESYSEGY